MAAWFWPLPIQMLLVPVQMPAALLAGTAVPEVTKLFTWPR